MKNRRSTSASAGPLQPGKTFTFSTFSSSLGAYSHLEENRYEPPSSKRSASTWMNGTPSPGIAKLGRSYCKNCREEIRTMSVPKGKKDQRGRIDFDHLGIGTALSRGHLAVPLNQREYSWEEKQVTELFQDFSKAISNHKSSYFLGTIVLTQSGDEVPQVADGQQRLATTTILFAAMRDWLFDIREARRVTSIENDFLFKIDRDTNEIEPRLKLNVDDNEFFRQRILEKPDSPKRKIQAPKQSHKTIEGLPISPRR